MLHNEYIEYLKRENKTNYEDYKSYYIQRKLKRFVQIDKNILKIDDDKKKKDILIVNSQEDFAQKCHEQPNKSIHYLKSDINQSLTWIKSHGRISVLNDFIINKEEFCFSIDEENVLNETENETILLISAEPGMGKSYILDSFAQNSNSKNFFLKIVLNDFTDELENFKEGKIKINEAKNALGFVLTKILRKTNELEISLLKHLAQEQKLILLFDGVDEVSDYKEQVKTLITTLNETKSFKKILITTRKNFKEDLEEFFQTISFNLNNFDSKDQINFLVKYWHKINEGFEQKILKTRAEKLISKLKMSLTDNINQLVGIPLQTKMLADIYQN